MIGENETEWQGETAAAAMLNYLDSAEYFRPVDAAAAVLLAQAALNLVELLEFYIVSSRSNG